MDKKNFTSCGKCGRPFPVATEPKCNWSCGPMSECCGCSLGRIEKNVDPCKSCCVIPALTIETVDGLTTLANCFVHVISTNTTYYIDDKHRPMIIWTGPIEVDIPETVITDEDFLNFVKGYNLRSQFLYARHYSTDTQQYRFVSVYFDKNGKPYWAGEYEEITEEV